MPRRGEDDLEFFNNEGRKKKKLLSIRTYKYIKGRGINNKLNKLRAYSIIIPLFSLFAVERRVLECVREEKERFVFSLTLSKHITGSFQIQYDSVRVFVLYHHTPDIII